MKKIKKILIANRGEIALRIIRACRELSIATVAVYSEVDRLAVHTLVADEAFEIGPAPPVESYLNIEKIINVARERQCDAIHPGYGFLAENALFAQSCREAGLIFIGPNPEAMELVGDKLKARATMQQAKIPLIPGIDGHLTALEDIEKKAKKIGYPLLIKASAGGGGKGMRIVNNYEEFHSALQAAQREAMSAFGDDTVYVEKFIRKPRHVEFQVLADNHGNMIHLGERECSIQRRHQKIIEESPSPALDDNLRQQMGEAACRVMKAAGYNNAGTVEFLLDEKKNFYFLEVNARIQVEHPVTELVTSIDLVKQQIRIASGEALSFSQEDIQQRGHSIECRIYAEDPENNFFPSVGKLLFVKEPHGPGVRCDSGIYTGLEIMHHYDPILSKLIVWDESRDAAIMRMSRALSDYIIMGVKTNIPFMKDVVIHPGFRDGDVHTGFLDDYFSDWKPVLSDSHIEIALLTAAYARRLKKAKLLQTSTQKIQTPWQTIGEWEILGKVKK
ncbi:MAG: acetyl-CoA carboxylase biotin carboxylase subunit [Calditrichia bacterium]